MNRLTEASMRARARSVWSPSCDPPPARAGVSVVPARRVAGRGRWRCCPVGLSPRLALFVALVLCAFPACRVYGAPPPRSLSRPPAPTLTLRLSRLVDCEVALAPPMPVEPAAPAPAPGVPRHVTTTRHVFRRGVLEARNYDEGTDILAHRARRRGRSPFGAAYRARALQRPAALWAGMTGLGTECRVSTTRALAARAPPACRRVGPCRVLTEVAFPSPRRSPALGARPHPVTIAFRFVVPPRIRARRVDRVMHTIPSRCRCDATARSRSIASILFGTAIGGVGAATGSTYAAAGLSGRPLQAVRDQRMKNDVTQKREARTGGLRFPVLGPTMEE